MRHCTVTMLKGFHAGISRKRNLAQSTIVSCRTHTHVFHNSILAGSSILARIRSAVVDIDGAILACETRLAYAAIIVDLIVAGTTIGTGFGETVIHVCLAGSSHIAGNTLAPAIYTNTAVLTRIGRTFVALLLAVVSCKTVWTLADIRAIGYRTASTIKTRIFVAR